jgi:sarcosine oxidase subunit beta
LEADLAWESLTDYFELWGERVGGGCGFTQSGFAFLAGSEDSSAVKSNVAMLREQVGIDTELINPAELNEIDPALETGDVVIAAYEPRSGYADPSATTISLLRAAQKIVCLNVKLSYLLPGHGLLHLLLALALNYPYNPRGCR